MGKILNILSIFISGCGVGGSAMSFTHRARCILLMIFEFNVYCIITEMTKVTVFAVVLVAYIHQLLVEGML